MKRRRATMIVAAILAALGTGWVAVRSWLPWISLGADGRWRIGPASRFPRGSATLLRRANAIVVSDELGLHALSATCTHEGCPLHPLRARSEIVCNCHGAAYDWQGRVKRGPAPQALPWLDLRAEGGELVLDPSRTVRPESA